MLAHLPIGRRLAPQGRLSAETPVPLIFGQRIGNAFSGASFGMLRLQRVTLSPVQKTRSTPYALLGLQIKRSVETHALAGASRLTMPKSRNARLIVIRQRALARFLDNHPRFTPVQPIRLAAVAGTCAN